MQTTRWSGADWASEQRFIYLIGLGGIGSWTALNLARIGHSLCLIDGDVVDQTNVGGGQMYRTKDIGKNKVACVHEICREFGCSASMETYNDNYNVESFGINAITICGLDNMAARKEIFEAWVTYVQKEKKSDRRDCLFIDGRLLLENMEIFTIKGNDGAAIAEYRQKYLFDDSEVATLDCTTKQCTFSAMTIAGLITTTLCNWLTNQKLDMEMRTVPFHQRLFLPIFDLKQQLVAEKIEEYA
jgi:molybdopterin/thiamine biosynthesis adenylyltransferase